MTVPVLTSEWGSQRPSVYEVMKAIVQEELEELPKRLRQQRGPRMAGCLTSALCTANLRDRAATGEHAHGCGALIDSCDEARGVAFLKTGVWPG